MQPYIVVDIIVANLVVVNIVVVHIVVVNISDGAQLHIAVVHIAVVHIAVVHVVLEEQEGAEAYLQDDEELVSRLPLHHDLLPVLKLHRLQRVGHGEPLPLLQGL